MTAYPFVLDVIRSHVRAGEILLDLGFGDGGYRGPAMEMGLHYLGVDQRIDRAPADPAGLVAGDFQNLPFQTGSVDVLLAVASLYLSGPTCFSELRRVLRPGGRLFVFDYRVRILRRIRADLPAANVQVWTPRDLMEQLTRSGFPEVARMTHKPSERPYSQQYINRAKAFLRSDWVILMCSTGPRSGWDAT